MAPLTVYRASAGAGKTFRLVVEYIKLLMLRPDEYKSILAVTFTKKATQEMKIRILSQLYGLREGLSSSAGYMKCITEEMNLPEKTVQKNAAVALNMILNDYGHFRIETIDSFFQRVLRNMTRELDIASNMRVELNGEQVKDKAVDELIDNLEPTDHIFQRIKKFAQENMSEGKNWNIINELKDFGKHIFTDFYQGHSKEYKALFTQNASKNVFSEYKKNLNSLIDTSTEDIKSAAETLRETIESQGFNISIFSRSDHCGLGKMYSYIENGDVLTVPPHVRKSSENEEIWFKAADKKKYGLEKVTNIFQPALRAYIELHDNLAKLINTSVVILRNLNNIELLGAIEDAVDKSNKNANRFLLSSTNQLLAEMIGRSDSPFIYEKIGTQVRHLMIDEFQDTSTLQWKNFKNLLQESMSFYDQEEARGTVGSMIVGDVKQSIYRWRNGDWKLLDNIQDEFANASDTEIKNLDTNYRSEANIINFNNDFFDQAKVICEVKSAYNDVEQKVKPGRKEQGEVVFFMLSENLYKQRHDMICKKVNELISRGVKAKDIAILGRNNFILKELSKEFMDKYPNIKVVSMESFILGSSTAVCAIICALRLMLNPTDRILLATLEKYSGLTAEQSKKNIETIDSTKPLLDIVEDIFRLFHIDEFSGDSAFVSSFFDYLKDFASKNTSTIRNFLKYWDETVSAKAIETEATDGVQMMTIHKSKGLEFDNVIIADGGWAIDMKKSRIWVEIDEAPFSDVPFNILQPQELLEETIFADDYAEEKKNNTIDHLNLLYVAFTRAGKNLYYYGRTSRNYEELKKNSSAKKYSTGHVSGIVEQCLDQMNQESLSYKELELNPEDQESIEEFDEEKFFGYQKQFGSFAIKEQKKELDKASDNVFEMHIEPIGVKLHQSNSEVEFVQSNRSKDFIVSSGNEKTDDMENKDSDQSKGTNSFISTGLLLHNVLSQINSINDIDNVLQRLECEGVIANKKHSSLIRKRIESSEHAQRWFSNYWTVYNECSILTSEGIKRPDRVITNGDETIVIDFKFGKPKPEYHKQVETYKQLLKEIGMPNVTGFLWYIYTDKVEEV